MKESKKHEQIALEAAKEESERRVLHLERADIGAGGSNSSSSDSGGPGKHERGADESSHSAKDGSSRNTEKTSKDAKDHDRDSVSVFSDYKTANDDYSSKDSSPNKSPEKGKSPMDKGWFFVPKIFDWTGTPPSGKESSQPGSRTSGTSPKKSVTGTGANGVGTGASPNSNSANAQVEKRQSDSWVTEGTQNVLVVTYRLYQHAGLPSLWSGLTTSLYLVSNPVIQYGLYDVIKKRYARSRKTISPFLAFIIGSFTKTIATIVTYPLQVAQSRLRREHDKTFMECFMEIGKNEGHVGYFKGIGPKLVQTVLNAAFMFAFYETLLRWVRGVVKLALK